MPIKIIVDSASDITKEEAKILGIEVIPMEITIGDELFLDGYNLSTTRFYEKLVESDVLPKTSQITPYRYEQTYKKYVNDGYEVIVITLSSKLSATYNSALQASKKFNGKVKVLGKARGSKKAKNMLTELVTQKGGIDFSLPFGAVYSGLTDVYVKKYIEDSRYLWEKEVKEVPIHLIGCTIGTHVGPGAIGVAFFQK